MSQSWQDIEEGILHEALNGQVPNAADSERNTPTSTSVPVGTGPFLDTPFFTGRSQNVRTTWNESGWGHDSQRWPTYPYSVGDNPSRRKSPIGSVPSALRENFALLAYVTANGGDTSMQGLYRATRQQGNSHGAIISTPQAIPYTDTVPTYGGGAMPHPGLDVPLENLYGP